MFSSPNELWVKVVKAFHGHEGGFDNNGCSFKGIWANIVGSSNFLYSKGIILSNSFRFKAGCGTRIRFWKDIWNWSRTNLGARNLSFFRDILNEIGQVNIKVSEDTCVWILGPKGTFTVKDARNLIDQKSLPSTTLEKSIPRKVNIFIWRLSLDRIPHTLNLSLRGMDIPTISCSSCNTNVESANHIFFECTIASDMWKLVYRWCDIPFIQALSFEAFKDWFSFGMLLKIINTSFTLSLHRFFGGFGDSKIVLLLTLNRRGKVTFLIMFVFLRFLGSTTEAN
uniref:Reverse transcriptase zinc-binding domain-containing protein n=1 Tax=Tanacetum cinerariifolium TaxID=118510 RepID=A0A6L2JG90_TANCI|nr:hypothetical protein [Tanacetum cinerariifolium]